MLRIQIQLKVMLLLASVLPQLAQELLIVLEELDALLL